MKMGAQVFLDIVESVNLLMSQKGEFWISQRMYIMSMLMEKKVGFKTMDFAD
jgi:hypothetical protein